MSPRTMWDTRSALRRNNYAGTSSDVRQLISALGGDSAVAAFYDYRYGVTGTGVVDSWADVRGSGSGAGPALTGAGAARPTILSDRRISFDGVDDFLRADSALWNAVPDNSLISVIWTPPAAQSGVLRLSWILSIGSGNDHMQARIDLTTSTLRLLRTAYTTVTGDVVVGLSGTRVSHNRHTSGGLLGCKLGSAAEISATSALVTYVASRFTLGASDAASPAGNFCDMIVKAVIICNASGTALQTAINAWAQSVHGATL